MNKNQVKSVMKGFAGSPAGSWERKEYSRQVPGRVREPGEEQEEAKEPPEDHEGAELIYFGKSQ